MKLVWIFGILFSWFLSGTAKTVPIGVESSNGITNFDVWHKWPECKDVFQDIQDQSTCNSSWAISVATSIRDRRCIQTGAKNQDPISAWDLISCCDDCKLDGQNGCNGGSHDKAFLYYQNSGIVTGGDYHSKQGCKPYPLAPTLKTQPTQTQCESKCESSYDLSYSRDKHYGSGYKRLSSNNKDIMNEIFNNGPVVAEFKLYEDFLYYDKGIYSHDFGQLVRLHYVKIVGWGEESGVPFWRAVNSVGDQWGENGLFRIKRGNDECGFESNIIAAGDLEYHVEETTTSVPVKSTACPVKSTIQLKDTTSHAISTTNPVSKTSTVVGYYTGTFQWIGGPYSPFNAQFQVKLIADYSTQLIKIAVEHVNPNCTYNNKIRFSLFTHTDHFECVHPYNDCSFPFYEDSWFNLDVDISDSYYNTIMHLDNIKDAFELNNPTNGCTNNQLVNASVPPDTSLFSYCVCYDEYKEGGGLSCPYNPWNHGGDFSHSNCIPTPTN